MAKVVAQSTRVEKAPPWTVPKKLHMLGVGRNFNKSYSFFINNGWFSTKRKFL